MEKINKLATIVATAARMEKKAEKEKYEVPVRLVFRGMVTCEANSQDEADNIVLQNFSGILDRCENNLEESIVDWDIETHSDIEFDEEQVVATKKSNLNKKAAYLDNEVERKKLLYETEKELKKDMQTIDTIIKKIKDSIETSTTKAIKHEKIFHKDEAKNGNDLELSKFWVKMQNLYDEYLQKAKDMIEK